MRITLLIVIAALAVSLSSSTDAASCSAHCAECPPDVNISCTAWSQTSVHCQQGECYGYQVGCCYFLRGGGFNCWHSSCGIEPADDGSDQWGERPDLLDARPQWALIEVSSGSRVADEHGASIISTSPGTISKTVAASTPEYARTATLQVAGLDRNSPHSPQLVLPEGNGRVFITDYPNTLDVSVQELLPVLAKSLAENIPEDGQALIWLKTREVLYADAPQLGGIAAALENLPADGLMLVGVHDGKISLVIR